MLNGKHEGNMFTYYKDGNVSHQYQFRNGTLNGRQTTYYQNGMLLSEHFAIDNVRNGPHRTYHENGKLHIEYEASNGLNFGSRKVYYSTGMLKIAGNKYNYYPVERDIHKLFMEPKELKEERGHFRFKNSDPANEEGLKDSKKILKFLKKMDKIISIDPNMDFHYFYRSIINYVQMDYDASILDVRKALELEPNSKIAQYYLSIMLMAQYGVDNVANTPKDIKNEICIGLNTGIENRTFYKDYSVKEFAIKIL